MTYDEIPGWFTYEGLYRRAVAEAPPAGDFAEVGCFLGRSAAFLAGEVKASGKAITLWCVDSWDNYCAVKGDQEHQAQYLTNAGLSPSQDLLAEFLGNVAACGASGVVRPVKMRSPQAAALFDAGSFDFVFIDASHDYDSVTADLGAWWPLVRPGGTMAGHDYANGHGAVDAAVRDFFRSEPWSGEQCWLVRKPSP